MATPTDQEIAQIAATYSIPPSVLLGVVKQEGVSPTYSLPTATLGAYNLSVTSMRDDPTLALSVVARTLAQSFAQTGNWESAVSVYLTGDPTAWQSTTSNVGGQVMGILGQAATDPTFGMAGYQPADAAAFQSSSAAFAQHLQSLTDMGGVVTQQSVQSYRSTVASIGTQQFQPAANMEQVAEDILNQAKIPVTDANVALITTMARGEGMNPATNNWLATTTPEPGSGQFNSVGVQTFPTYQEGVDATARTLLNGNYDRMVQLMRSGADLKTIASDPGVAQNLRTWQGGSSEDVNNLRGLENIPGTQSKGQQGQEKAPPDPAKVGEFATQLKGAGIDPEVFSEHFAMLAAQRRKLLGSQRTDVSDFANMQQALARQQLPVSNAGILAHLRGEPHPTYPSVTVGDFHDTFNKASLYSTLHTGAFPSMGEAANLVGLDNRQLSDYFQQKAQQGKTVTAPSTQPSQPNNVIAMQRLQTEKSA